MSKEIRFKGIVATLAQIAADAFAGRISWASDLARPVHYYTDSDYAVLARKDVAETFPGVKITNQAGPVARMVQAGTDGTQSAVSAATARSTIGAAKARTVCDDVAIIGFGVSTEVVWKTVSISASASMDIWYYTGGEDCTIRLYDGTQNASGLFYTATLPAGGTSYHLTLVILAGGGSGDVDAYVEVNGVGSIVNRGDVAQFTENIIITAQGAGGAAQYIVFRRLEYTAAEE